MIAYRPDPTIPGAYVLTLVILVVFSNLNVRPQQSDREYCAMVTKLFRYDLYIEVHTFHPQWTKILTMSFLNISIYGK